MSDLAPIAVEALEVGMLLRENSPTSRGRHRVMRVIRIMDRQGPPSAALESTTGAGNTIIACHRIHLDGEPRRSGWSVVA